jgi:SpoVK/Ycf46/Vps4 family AAA+-type ATPase
MGRLNYGPLGKKRTKRLLEVLLAYANDELEESASNAGRSPLASQKHHLNIKFRWKTENQLLVETKVRVLEELTILDQYPDKLTKEQIKESLQLLRKFLEILVDNRAMTQGSEDWHFTLKLWYRRYDTEANLKRFDAEWERRRLEKSKQLAGEKFIRTELDAPETHLAVEQQTKADQHSGHPATTPVERITGLQDWGEAPDVSSFYGRTEELSQLEQWMVQDHCKVVALLGMGGIGKTTLAVMLADQIQEHFNALIWRSLKAAPPLQTFLGSLIEFLSHGQETLSSQDIQQGISQLINHLRRERCLVILDEAEAIFRTNEGKSRPRHGLYQEGYEGYGELLRRVGGERHQSCIVLTSREKPEEIVAFEGKNLPVRSLQLRGLQVEDAKEIFRAKGFSGSEMGLTELIELYAGNPLALKVITTMIQEVFNGNIAQFLKQNTLVLGDRVRTLLKQQVSRLSDLEKEVVYWLAIEQEPISLSRLLDDLLFPPMRSQLMEVLASLERRSLIDKMIEASEPLFTLQPLVMKYATEEFVEQALDEIDAVLETQDIGKFKLLRNHSLIKPHSSSNLDCRGVLQYAPTRMLTRLRDGLREMFRCDDSSIGEELSEILPLLEDKSPLTVGYVGRNLLEIFKALGMDSDVYNWQDISIR